MDESSSSRTLSSAWRLAAAFGALAFLQGFSEPTEGIVSQPVRSLLSSWGRTAGQIGAFAAVVAIPWGIKPLLGLMADSLPLGRSGRRSYIIASGAVAAFVFLALSQATTVSALAAGLFVATLALAMADVATDALIVEWGRADGQTGRYQAATWFSLYASGVLTGTAGGAFSLRGLWRESFLLASASAIAMLALAAVFLRGSVSESRRIDARDIGKSLVAAARSPSVLAVAGFLAVGNFNPFTSTVLQLHITGTLGFDEQFFGHTISLLGLSSMLAAVVYGVYCRSVSSRFLANTSVALGVVSTLAYLGLRDRPSTLVVTLIVGLTSMTATLVQLELAARVCPPGAAATVFAALMSVSNLSASLATWLGGLWYETMGTALGRPAAFQSMVWGFAALASIGWLIVPWLPLDRPETHGPS